MIKWDLAHRLLILYSAIKPATRSSDSYGQVNRNSPNAIGITKLLDDRATGDSRSTSRPIELV